jgi:hypothetical protein
MRRPAALWSYSGGGDRVSSLVGDVEELLAGVA